jgi:hypothetical protein
VNFFSQQSILAGGVKQSRAGRFDARLVVSCFKATEVLGDKCVLDLDCDHLEQFKSRDEILSIAMARGEVGDVCAENSNILHHAVLAKNIVRRTGIWVSDFYTRSAGPSQ